MMAPDSSLPPRAPLPPATLASLRGALLAFARNPSEDAGLREALQQLAADARARTIPPEEVLVQLKQLWGELPVPEHRGASIESSRTLQRAVTICIQEYFR